ncbi:MAG TPA: M15 family metallopeptidase, partial [Roseomonas sp.]|nr:M15 family metallopeptidase [Roseomonas sp.]
EQGFMRDAGIETGRIDGLVGPQTLFAREAFQHLDATGSPLSIPERDQTPRRPVPPGGAAARWPRQAECERFYGPVGANQTMVRLPYAMRLAWDTSVRISRFSCHEKVHDAFLTVFTDTLAEYGEARIEELRLDLFGGCLNVRTMRGGTQPSMHSWGIAVDLDPERNALRMSKREAAFARPEYEPFWRIVEGQGLVSLGRVRDFDWMHFQAARL